MSKFTSEENFNVHTVNMDYTSIQNMKAEAIDNQDWTALDNACAIEDNWLKSQ
jgi:hypothetical protein